MPNVALTHGYDAASRRTSLAASIDGTADFSNAYTFDTLSRMTRIEQTDGAPVAGYTVSNKRVDLTYNAVGQFTQIARYEDLAGTDLVATSAYVYDSAGRLADLTHAKGANTLADYSWSYDAHNRITQFVSPDGTSTYSYDKTDQLTASDNSARPDEAFAWDLNGNPTGTGYTVGTNNRLLADPTYDYSDDPEGNLIRQTTRATGEYTEFDWDHRNRLVGVSFRNSAGVLQKRVEYDYDLFDRRIGKRVDDDGSGTFDRSDRYVYDGEDVVFVFDGAGSLAHRYLHGPGYDQALADEVFASGEIFWLLDDNQGTVRDMADYDAATDTTTVANHIEYDSYGAVLVQSDPSIEVFYAYTGQEYDADTGLVYYGGRWYSPRMRRFVSPDPSGFTAGDTNLVRYVGNAPTTYIDPTGRQKRNVNVVTLFDGNDGGKKQNGGKGWVADGPYFEGKAEEWPHHIEMADKLDDTLEALRAWVAQHGKIDNLKFFDHGSAGRGQQVGRQRLTPEFMKQLAPLLHKGAWLELYGCNVGANETYLRALADAAPHIGGLWASTSDVWWISAETGFPWATMDVFIRPRPPGSPDKPAQ